jgi:iron complex transport system ATP-binding protein
MQSFHNRNINTLSGGEQQRIHLARALAQLIEDPMPETPKYLLLDEPVSNLDIAQQHVVLALISQLAASPSLGVLIVLHDMNLAGQYADRVMMMKNGQLVCGGTPAQVFTEECIRQVFEVSAIVGKHPVYDCPQVVAY